MKPYFHSSLLRRLSLLNPNKPLSSQPNPLPPTQTQLLTSLLSHKSDPSSALHLFKTNPSSLHSLHTVAVMLHILMPFPETHARAKTLLYSYVSSGSGPAPALLVDSLLDCAKRFEFDSVSSPVFSYLLNSYVRADRIRDAVNCLERMVEIGVCGSVECMNIVLKALFRRNMFKEAKELYGGMVGRGVGGDCATLHVMMRVCFKEGKPGEAEEYFRNARGRGIAADGELYDVAIWAACMSGHLCLGLVLLDEMREMGLVLSGRSYTGVIRACVKKGDRKGMTASFHIYTALIVGNFKEGKLQKSFKLHDEMLDKGLVPDDITCDILINGKFKGINVPPRTSCA